MPKVPENYLHPKWDMSEWVVHFTKSEEALRSILSDRRIHPSGPFGQGRNVAEVAAGHQSACLSEIPLDRLDRLYARHGRWGIGFDKEFVSRVGGARVWYLDADSSLGKVLFRAVGSLLRAQDFEDPLWRMTPFIDSMADGEPYSYRFDWEREWRVPGGLQFDLDDVAFVMTPTGFLDSAKALLTSSQIATLPSTTGSSFGKSASEKLGNDSDAQIELFLESFTDPVNELPYDSEDGGYVWLVTEWDTEDAVRDVFGEITPGLQALIAELNGLSTSWVSRSEANELGADD
jgi:hypothetical protein